MRKLLVKPVGHALVWVSTLKPATAGSGTGT